MRSHPARAGTPARPMRDGSLAGEFLADNGVDRAPVRASLQLRHHLRHHSAHVVRAAGYRRTNGSANLVGADLRREISLQQRHLELLLVSELLTARFCVEVD